MQNLPTWVLPPSKERESTPSKSYIKDRQTNFLKGAYLARFLRDRVLTQNPDPSVLVVGIGALKDPLWCPLIPYQVVAEFERANSGYGLDILDIDSRILDDIRTRHKIFFMPDPQELVAMSEHCWQEYLNITGQTGNITNAREEGLVFEWEAAGAKAPTIYTEALYLREGINVADIPRGFADSLERNRIRLIQGDIASYPLAAKKYDAVDCTNVLYQLPETPQMSAVYNIAQSLKTGGLFRVNDIGGYYGSPLFEETGGWLDGAKLRDLGLTKEIFEPDYNGLAAFFTRKSGDNRPTSVNAVLLRH